MKSADSDAKINALAGEVVKRIRSSRPSNGDKKLERAEEFADPYQAGIALAQSGAEAFRRSLGTNGSDT